MPPFFTIRSCNSVCVERSHNPKATSFCSRGRRTRRPLAMRASRTFAMAAPGFCPTYRRCLVYEVWRRRTAARSFLFYCSAAEASLRAPLAAVDGCEARAAANAWSWLLPKRRH